MTEATWGDAAKTPGIDWRMSAALENVPRGGDDLAEVTSLEGAVREWLSLDPEHRGTAVLTPERPLLIDGSSTASLSADGIAALAEPPGRERRCLSDGRRDRPLRAGRVRVARRAGRRAFSWPTDLGAVEFLITGDALMELLDPDLNGIDSETAIETYVEFEADIHRIASREFVRRLGGEPSILLTAAEVAV